MIVKVASGGYYELVGGGDVNLVGSRASAGNMALVSTAHATKGKIVFGNSAFDEANERLGVNTQSPAVRLHVVGDQRLSGYLGVGFNGSAPNNTTAGDITGIRAHFGTDAAMTANFGVDINAKGLVLGGTNASTQASFLAQQTFNGTDVANPLAFHLVPVFDLTATPVAGAWASYMGPTFNPQTSKTLTAGYGLQIVPITGSGGGAITSMYGLYVIPSYGSIKPTSVYGINIENMGSASITNAIAVRIAKPTNATNNYYMEFDTNNAAALGAYQGKLPVVVAGVAGFIPWYL